MLGFLGPGNDAKAEAQFDKNRFLLVCALILYDELYIALLCITERYTSILLIEI